MYCPLCKGNGLVYQSKILNPQSGKIEEIFFCDECYLTWNQKSNIRIDNANYLLENYLKSLGYEGKWEELIEPKPL